jgi:hypothetical protein
MFGKGSAAASRRDRSRLVASTAGDQVADASVEWGYEGELAEAAYARSAEEEAELAAWCAAESAEWAVIRRSMQTGGDAPVADGERLPPWWAGWNRAPAWGRHWPASTWPG